MTSTDTAHSFSISPRIVRLSWSAATVGTAIIVAGMIFAPGRIWPNILLAGFYLLGTGVSAALFLAFAAVTNAGWTAVIRRVPEAVSHTVFAGGLWMLVVLLGLHSIYEWSHEAAVAEDAVLQGKSAWLNTGFFAVRTFLYVLIWGGLTAMMLRVLRRQDTTSDVGPTLTMRKVSGTFIVVFALTSWLSSMDWIMSIEPHWYSTIFGVYTFSGNFLTALAVITIVVIALRRRGWMGTAVREAHLHDLGKLIFAFSTFWMYIWFSQYILIWYANIPEETVYFVRRGTAGWGTLTLLNIAFNWVIPFVFLLSARAKRNEGVLMRISFVILIGHWIDLFWMIFPMSMPETPVVGVWEAGAVLAAGAIGFIVVARALQRSPLIPEHDPYMVESMTYHS